MEGPKLFVSYSWSSPDHEEWVVQLATELRESGVDAVLDKWDLKEGDDAYAFMERMVTDPEIGKVVMICDKVYAEKADARSGGAGAEAQIISSEIYKKVSQTKFVAVVKERDAEGKPCVPTYYKSRIYIDLSDDDVYDRNFEQLLRWIYDEPLHKKPELGDKPSFLAGSSISLGTTAAFRRATDAIRNSKAHAKGALGDYFEAFIENLERFRISHDAGEFDDKVVESIGQFLPFRNEAVEMFLALAQYGNDKETHQQLHRFFEQLIPYLHPPENIGQWTDGDFDSLRFIVHELLLCCVAALLKHECFDAVAYLLRHRYYYERNLSYGREGMQSFASFYQPPRSLDHRNERLQLRRLSLHADLLNERCKRSGLTIRHITQADFVLFVRDCLDSLSAKSPQKWWPVSLVYLGRRGGVLELFGRAESKAYFEDVKRVFDIDQKEDLEPLFAAFEEKKLSAPKWEFDTISAKSLLGYDKLASRP